MRVYSEFLSSSLEAEVKGSVRSVNYEIKTRHRRMIGNHPAGQKFFYNVLVILVDVFFLILNAGSLSSEHFLLWACLIEEGS